MSYEDFEKRIRDELLDDEILVSKFNRMTKKYLEDHPGTSFYSAQTAVFAILTIPLLGTNKLPDKTVMECVYELQGRIAAYYSRGYN